MALTGRVRNGGLTVSGEAAETAGLVEIIGDASSLQDNNSPSVTVEIDSDGTAVRSIDARGLKAAGATIYNYANRGVGSRPPSRAASSSFMAMARLWPSKRCGEVNLNRHARVFAGIHDLGSEPYALRKSWITGSAGHDG